MITDIHANIIAAMEDRLCRANTFFQMRAEYPLAPARRIWEYIIDDNGMSWAEFNCPGHEWTSGYDDSDHEIPIRCIHCGADGDA